MFCRKVDNNSVE